jgi:putative transposase
MGPGAERHHRRSTRLPEYDYASPGAYFVTVCAHDREPLFNDHVLQRIVEQTWHDQQDRFPGISLDAFVVMPNHVHFILWLNPVGAPLAGAQGAGRAGASPAPTLAQVVGSFKSIVAMRWLKWLERNAPGRSGRVWQRNYYERVIRDEDEIGRIREYILHNPLGWEFDGANPDRTASREYERQWSWLEGSSRGTACCAPTFPR